MLKKWCCRPPGTFTGVDEKDAITQEQQTGSTWVDDETMWLQYRDPTILVEQAWLFRFHGELEAGFPSESGWPAVA